MSRITPIVSSLRLIFSSRKIADQMGEIEHRLNKRSDRYERAIDDRIDERFESVERRLEAHELRTDQYMSQRRVEIIDRADVMLQIFEQRLDQRRREIQALRETLAGRDAAAKPGAASNGSSSFEDQPSSGAPIERYPKELYID
jgi:hypothetical protein